MRRFTESMPRWTQTSMAVVVLTAAFLWRDAPERPAPIESRSVAVPVKAPIASTVASAAIDLDPSIERDAELADELDELARRDPAAAATRLRALSEVERRRVIAAVLVFAARRPEEAAQLARRFCAADPAEALEHGHALVAALVRAGEFGTAVRIVQDEATADGESEHPDKWLRAIYAAWAERTPALAAMEAGTLASAAMREEALQAVAAAWLARDPEALAAFVTALPSGPVRSGLLAGFVPVAK